MTRETLVQAPPEMPDPTAPDPNGPDARALDGTRASAPGPLDPQQLRQIEIAGARMRKLRGAMGVARFNGFGLWACAVIFLPLSILDPSMLIAVVLLAVFGSVELYGGGLLRELEPRGVRVLIANQAAVFVAIALYCATSIYVGLTGPNPYETLLSEYPDLGAALGGADAAQLEALEGTVEGAYRASVVVFYLVVLGIAAIYQGLCALYYRGRAGELRSYIAETPAWIRELQRRLA